MSENYSTQSRLTVELERAALRELYTAYGDLNDNFFRNTLRRPVLELVDAASRLGRWVAERRTLEIARSLLADHGWGIVVEVLKHEMAHQYVDEVLARQGESAHGPAFRQVCSERGIDARASGLPGVGPIAGVEARLLERVAKLLSLAQSSNQNEAQAAMNAAQRLMLKYNLEALAQGTAGSYGFRHLGEPTGRVSESQRVLARILDDHFFVDVIWVPVWRAHEGKRGSVLEVCGTPENLELAEYVHVFLTTTSERLWREHQRARAIRGNADRRRFVAGVMSGFRDKLEAERCASREQGLIWVGDTELDRFYRQRHPRVRMVRHVGAARNAAYSEGRAAGRRIVLHRGVGAGPSGVVRLLAK
jgi:hypothetical protein